MSHLRLGFARFWKMKTGVVNWFFGKYWKVFRKAFLEDASVLSFFFFRWLELQNDQRGRWATFMGSIGISWTSSRWSGRPRTMRTKSRTGAGKIIKEKFVLVDTVLVLYLYHLVLVTRKFCTMNFWMRKWSLPPKKSVSHLEINPSSFIFNGARHANLVVPSLVSLRWTRPSSSTVTSWIEVPGQLRQRATGWDLFLRLRTSWVMKKKSSKSDKSGLVKWIFKKLSRIFLLASRIEKALFPTAATCVFSFLPGDHDHLCTEIEGLGPSCPYHGLGPPRCPCRWGPHGGLLEPRQPWDVGDQHLVRQEQSDDVRWVILKHLLIQTRDYRQFQWYLYNMWSIFTILEYKWI